MASTRASPRAVQRIHISRTIDHSNDNGNSPKVHIRFGAQPNVILIIRYKNLVIEGSRKRSRGFLTPVVMEFGVGHYVRVGMLQTSKNNRRNVDNSHA